MAAMQSSQKDRPFTRFLVRWLVCGLGLWIAANLLSNSISYNSKLGVIVIAGLLLAVINIILKPILVILSLPAIVLSLGLFMILINGLTVFIVSKVYGPLHITNFWAAVFAGMVIGLVNFLVSAVLKEL
jgi:putative membrane protein